MYRMGQLISITSQVTTTNISLVQRRQAELGEEKMMDQLCDVERFISLNSIEEQGSPANMILMFRSRKMMKIFDSEGGETLSPCYYYYYYYSALRENS